MRIYDNWIKAAVAIARIVIGIIFLWAGLEKLIGTPGGFSAAGFLAHGTAGTLGWPFVGADAQGPFNPTMGIWVDLSKNSGMMGVVNFLVVFGELGIGVSLILGLLTRFGAAMGTLMMLLFFVAAWDWAFGIVNQHLTYAVVTLGLGVIGAGKYYGLDAILGPMVRPGIRRWFLSGEPEPQQSAKLSPAGLDR
jgi:thiosulfate dehydrogenase [quinone] large subunit